MRDVPRNVDELARPHDPFLMAEDEVELARNYVGELLLVWMLVERRPVALRLGHYCGFHELADRGANTHVRISPLPAKLHCLKLIEWHRFPLSSSGLSRTTIDRE